MKKELTRLFSVLLAAVLVFGTLPVSAMGTDVADPPASSAEESAVEESAVDESAVDDAAQPEEQSAEEENAAVQSGAAVDGYDMNVLLLDCGRKYYSADSIKTFIKEAHEAGFNYVQLVVGNEGLRFLLDDMSVQGYTSEQVATAIKNGNTAYNKSVEDKQNNHKAYNPETNELTQSEMTDIINYAHSLNMGVIPCVNSPGHMYAICNAIQSLTESSCTYKTSSEVDLANTTAVSFTKELLGKYMAYFAGMGCQYFNMGADEYSFEAIKNTNTYNVFVQYVNDIAAQIKDAGMTPMAFNDGVYYNSDTGRGTVDTEIIVFYWSSGWGNQWSSGYFPAKTSTLSEYRLINTNQYYYWALGNSGYQCDSTRASQFNYTKFDDGATISNPKGSMFCVWSDFPGDGTEDDVIQRTKEAIAAFGATLPKTEPVTETPTTPSEPDTGKPTITAPEGANALKVNGTTTLEASEKVTWTVAPEGVVDLASADEVVTYSSSVCAQKVKVTAVQAGSATITATDENGKTADFQLTVTAAEDVLYENVDVTLTVGEKKDTDKLLSGDFTSGNYSNDYVTVKTEKITTDGTTSYETVTLADAVNVETGKLYVSTSAASTTPTTQLTLESAGNGQYYVKRADGQYIYPDATYTSIYFTGWWNDPSLKTSSTGVAVEVTESNGRIVISKNVTSNGQNKDFYITLSRNAFSASSSDQDLYLYEQKTTGGTTTTKVSFTGKKVTEQPTEIIIGTVKYFVTVTAQDLSEVDPLEIEYWITNNHLIGNKTGTNTSVEIKATDSKIATEDGADVTDLVDAVAHKNGTGEDDVRERVFWQTRILDTTKDDNSSSKKEFQTTYTGDDETAGGQAFTKVRYWDGEWEVYTEAGWTPVDRTSETIRHYGKVNTSTDGYITTTREHHQLVAYYMEQLDISNAQGKSEMNVTAADWGARCDNEAFELAEYYSNYEFVSVSFQIISTTGYKNPEDTTVDALAPKTYLYNRWEKRGVGTLNFSSDDYEIYRVTAETGDVSYSTPTKKGNTNKYTTTLTGFTWNNDAVDVWGGEDNENPQSFVSINNSTVDPTITGDLRNLSWKNANKYKDDNNSAILIRVYVRPKTTTEQLKIHYMDGTKESGTAAEFYNTGIVVDEGVVFNPEFKKEGNALVHNDVRNSTGEPEYVKWKLEELPELSAKYKSGDYEFVDAERREDGKEVWLYYTFKYSAAFVIDFGTPLTIKPSDVWDTSNVQITGVSVKNSDSHGTFARNADNSITYTPGVAFAGSKNGESAIVTYSYTEDGKNDTITYNVYIYPASNVLYEENFLENKTEGSTWTEEKEVTHTAAQQTQKAGDDGYYTFGYDDSYDGVTSENGKWSITGLTFGERSAPLTTTFYGDTFDLIGECANDSGRVLLLIKGVDVSKNKLVVIDTRYNDGNGGKTVLYQVPLAHVELGVEGTYDVKVYTSGLNAIKDNATQAVAMMALDDGYTASDDDIAAILEENDLSLDDVEIVTTAMSQDGVSVASPVAAMSADDAATYATPVVAHPAGTHVEINGFRVYRSSAVSEKTDDTATAKTVADNYPASEQNQTYWNILHVVKGEITAYTEADKGAVEANVQDYEAKGGPQNEIFLTNKNSVQFQIESLAKQTIYVSLRAVNGTTKYNGNDISSITEMYYPITANDEGVFTIVCNGDNMLAIGNVKLPSSVEANNIKNPSKVSGDALVAALNTVLYGNQEKEVFTPETFTVKTTSTKVIRNKVVTLKINVSSDVAYVTINGVKYTRTGLQGMFQKTRTIRAVYTVPKNDEKTYEIIAYNADGVASEAITKTVK